MSSIPSGFVPLVQTTRGGTLDNIHFGAVAVCDASGKLVAHAGDPHWVAFTRSTIKALQALPFVMSGGPKQLGLTQRNLAMLCASHGGEPMHVEQIDDILGKAHVGYKRLQCGCHVPYHIQLAVNQPPPTDTHWDERHHNCSGKHSGFLAHCAVHGLPLETYLSPDHPLQRAVRSHLARAVGLQEDDLKLGIDGCSAPNYAMPLSALARGYARLATGARDSEFGEAFQPLAGAMRAHPELVSGTGRADNDYMRAGRGDWVTKAGADGIHVVASASRGQAIAVKVVDTNVIALQAATVEAMDQLGWLDDTQREALAKWRAATVTNWRGTPVGERKPVFKLQTA
ncbi:asparaginase [Ramlibacter albus]|uniref:Asparaginase n=1 Tax=Ramlibacter albus TaxID=2079448 RepID=A0A923S2T1_9BURK|nr:asparaginase [Ramlibacter albus]MBC5765098.1 asparaginase [Ramlibacter albus]